MISIYEEIAAFPGPCVSLLIVGALYVAVLVIEWRVNR